MITRIVITENAVLKDGVNEDKFRAALSDLKKRYEDRKLRLERMTGGEIGILAHDYGLPSDLNKSQRIKYILQKEFPVR